MKKPVQIALFLLGMVVGNVQAAAITLTFDEQPIGNCALAGNNSFSSQGFVFTTLEAFAYQFFSCTDPGLIAENPQTAVMINANYRSYFEMTASGGEAFSLMSLEAGSRSDYKDNPYLSFTSTGIHLLGTRVDGSSVSRDLQFDGFNWEVFSLSGFDNLTSLTWIALGDSEFAQFAFDNLSVRIGPTEVPEPGTLALLGLGFAGLAFTRRRKH